MSFGDYLQGSIELIAVAAAMAFAAVRLRRRLLPGWSGASARLAEVVLGLSLLVVTLELVGVVGLYRPGSKNTPPPGVFFDARQHSPTDGPEHFEHPNSAVALSGVWLAGSPAERQLEKLPGAKVVGGAFCAPFGYGIRAVHFKDAELVLLPERMRIVRGRPIVAATVTVKHLLTAQGFLDAMRVRYRREPGCGRNSLWVEAHGLWLEFLER